MENYKIIVAYDFQELSNVALKNVYDLARFVDSGILLVLVINDDLLNLSSDLFHNEHSDRFQKKITDIMEKEISERLQKVAESATAESGVSVGFRIETGKIYERILLVAKENRARFIVMGRTTKTDMGKFGSNAMHVVEEAPCPVITVPSVDSKAVFKNIVLPIDLTKQTREEVFNAISFGLFFDATINLVSVIMGGVSAKKSRIFKKMQGMKKMIEENGVRCTERLFKKSHKVIHEVVLSYCKEIDADALMIMTHKEISSSDKYIGAVAHQIIRESPIPVISLTSAASMHKRSEKTMSWFSKLFTTKK